MAGVASISSTSPGPSGLMLSDPAFLPSEMSAQLSSPSARAQQLYQLSLQCFFSSLSQLLLSPEIYLFIGMQASEK